MKKLAAVLFAVALAAAPILAFASTFIVPPIGRGRAGFCTVSKRGEVKGFPLKSAVVCQWPSGIDVTGDGKQEWVRLELILRRDGSIDCELSAWVILDLSKSTRQGIHVEKVC